MRKMRLTTKWVAIPLALAMVAGAASAAQVADEALFEIQFTEETEAELTVEQTWRGEAAQQFRSALDRGFGNGDGQLSEEEVQQIENATQADLEGIENPNLRLDNVSAVIESLDIETSGLQGPVDAPEPVALRHTVDVTFPLEEGLGEAHTLTFTPFVAGEVRILAPPGYTIADVSGFAGSPNVEEAMVTGTVPQGEEVTLELEPAPTGEDGAAGDEAPEEAGEEADQIPGPALLAVLAAVGLTAATLRARKRKE